ncbi:hypothetical protein AT302_07180 [Pandoraea norimbergensis]|uniref:Uncharacterized protein n=1 Tax=Pandoraea norimbergensis TaxID=93219 RepID=A0ABM5WI10_9BURK|nr:hypothetical protein AT302_07180 [Pandoraea norimbergensis]
MNPSAPGAISRKIFALSDGQHENGDSRVFNAVHESITDRREFYLVATRHRTQLAGGYARMSQAIS